MSIITAWHSKKKKKECEVYHNNTECTEENNIEPYNVKEGTGGKRLCMHCERLNRRSSVFGLMSLREKGFAASSLLNFSKNRL